MGQIKHKNNTK